MNALKGTRCTDEVASSITTVECKCSSGQRSCLPLCHIKTLAATTRSKRAASLSVHCHNDQLGGYYQHKSLVEPYLLGNECMMHDSVCSGDMLVAALLVFICRHTSTETKMATSGVEP